MNKFLSNAELVREKLGDLLPDKGRINFDKLNYTVKQLVNTPKGISSGVPLSMSSLIANYQMANFASQFQIKILLDGSKVPTNMVGFVLAGSGIGKDSTVYAMESAMNQGYMIIEEDRKERAKERAKAKAEAEDGDEAGWIRFYKEPNPLTNSISTVEGLTARLNQFSNDAIGMPSVYVGELGSELASNPNMTDNIRLISELYDLGNKKSKAIKDFERQDQEVKGMGMNALFVGSEDNIVLDKSIAQKFRTEFITKLARRSMFVYPSKQEFDECIVEYGNYDDMIEKQEVFENMAAEGSAYVNSASRDMAQQLLDRDSRLLNIDDDALQAFKDYKLYTNNLGQGMSFIYKSVQLELTHRSWKMLKLAGAYALWDLDDTIRLKHIREAMYFVETIGHYLGSYEEYAAKDAYELLVDFFRSNPESSLTLHDLKKRGFISGTSGIESRLKELVRLADSFAGADGTVKLNSDVMGYTQFEKVGDHYASYIQVKGSKQERASQCHSGFESKPTTFEKLSVLLSNDTAYTPFKFQDGKRANDNIISGATWVALDVDDADLSQEEMHSMLDGINHHISTTSDNQNPYKYRIIFEFNNVVDLPVREWKVFGKLMGEELGIPVDPATFTKSQIMFGYKGAKVLSTTDGDKYDVSPLIKAASEKVNEVFNKQKRILNTEKKTMLDNPMDTFSYLFNAEPGKGSLAMYRAYMHAFDLGATVEETEKLLHDVNYSFWEEAMDEGRFEKTILIPMRRKFAN